MGIKNIILGTVQFGLNYGINNPNGKPSTRVVEEIFTTAYHSGIQQLDTAEAYGDAQELIGRFHQKQATRFDINTKFKGANKTTLRTELAKAITALSVQQVNTWFYHSYTDYHTYPELLEELAAIRKEGLIRKIGVSVYSNEELENVINDPVIDVIQLPFNLLDNFSQRGSLLARAKQNQKTIQVRSVFLQGLFFKDPASLPASLLPLQPYLHQLHTLSAETGLSMESLCLQYVSAQENIDEIIIGVDTVEQLDRNMMALRSQLDQRVRNTIDLIKVTETALLYPYNWK